MTKSTITRERAQQIFLGNGPEPSASEERELARMALAAMDSEPHTGDELSNLLWYSQEATCHSDPNYYCEFQRLATPGLIAGIIRELQERRKVDSEPVILYRQVNPVNGMKTYWAELDQEEFRHLKKYTDENAEFMTLYRHAQQPVLLDGLIKAVEFYEQVKRENPPVETGAWKDAIDWVLTEACRAAMLQASPVCTCPSGDGSLRWPCPVHPGNSPTQSDCCPAQNGVFPAQGQGWIPVSEQMPDENAEQQILACFKGGDISALYYSDGRWDDAYGIVPIRQDVTHWMPMPAAPQEDINALIPLVSRNEQEVK